MLQTDGPVLVTGATGYVAGWIVKELLNAGLTVHAAVRNANNTDKISHLTKLAESSSGQIKFFEADLLKLGSYADAMAGCKVVFHTASPFITKVKDPQKDLVDPALLGTRNVLQQASNTPSVRRVVLTSSVAAMYGDNIDLQKLPGQTLTEQVWNTTSSLTLNPYSYSKTVAEKEAWNISKSQSQWDLVVINPALVFGPALNAKVTSESFNMIKQMGDGTMRFGAPRWGIGVVDVRDVAKAHFAAGFEPSASGRYIVCGHNTNILDAAKTLLPRFGGSYPIPRRAMPKCLFWLAAPIASRGAITRELVTKNVDHPFHASNERSKQELGLSYRPLSETMNDLFQQMVDNKAF
jgi:dihydroflavonol-4-reductase